jgi:uncharacterized protein YdhG (YjbR/CyaY superfamily)
VAITMSTVGKGLCFALGPGSSWDLRLFEVAEITAMPIQGRSAPDTPPGDCEPYSTARGIDTLVGKENPMKPAKKSTRKSPEITAATEKKSTGFTDEERVAMRERLQEAKAEARRGSRTGSADGEKDVLAKIAALPQPDRAMAERLHAIIKANAPFLSPRTWYGMPAYARDGNVVCFFQSAHKFKTRYATLGFSDKAKLDAGHMWPTSFALKELTAVEEAQISALVRKAAS